MSHIANHRYVVIGETADKPPRWRSPRWPIVATDSLQEAVEALSTGRSANGRFFAGVRIHDRRTDGIMPKGGWGA